MKENKFVQAVKEIWKKIVFSFKYVLELIKMSSNNIKEKVETKLTKAQIKGVLYVGLALLLLFAIFGVNAPIFILLLTGLYLLQKGMETLWYRI